MTVRVAINGFGRIGRLVLRSIVEFARRDIEVVAINDLGPVETNAHLLRYDSVHGRFPGLVEVDGDTIDVGLGKIKVTAIRDPAELPHKDARRRHRARMHRPLHLEGQGQARTSTPAPSGCWSRRPPTAPTRTIVFGVNHAAADRGRPGRLQRLVHHQLPGAGLPSVLLDTVGIERGYMTTIHAYTGDQPTLERLHSDLYRARAAAMSMIPTSTGAAKAIGLVIPELAGKLDGGAIRVPTPNVSMVDLVVTPGRATSKDEVNEAFEKAAGAARCAACWR